MTMRARLSLHIYRYVPR